MESCGYKCPGFDDADLCWIPYNIGDSLVYTDGETTIKFGIVDFYKTAPSSHGGLVMDYVCDYEGYYTTNKISLGYYIKEHLAYDIANFGTWGDGLKVQITDADIFVFDIWHYNSQVTDSLDIIFSTDTIIANHRYHNVFKLTKTKIANSQKISWVIKAKDKGIIQFYDRQLDKTWTLLDKDE
jgi:hypothetical protein